MNAPSTDLINTDYVVGIPLSWRSSLFSTRVRLYHQSTHLGDEFVPHNPGVNRVNYSQINQITVFFCWRTFPAFC
jgi:hypothetical protein